MPMEPTKRESSYSPALEGRAPNPVPVARSAKLWIDPMTSKDHSFKHEPRGRPRGRGAPPTAINQSRDVSSSPPDTNREHRTQTRSLSPHSKYEFQKEEFRHRENFIRERYEAGERVERLEREKRQHQREEWERQAQAWRERREAIRQQEKDRERVRRQQDQEYLEHYRADQAGRLLREEREREQRLQEEERRRAAEREVKGLRRLRDEQARRHQVEQQHRLAGLRGLREPMTNKQDFRTHDEQARLQAAELQRRFAEEERRLAERKRRAQTPRATISLHFHNSSAIQSEEEGINSRGERFMRDAIRDESLRSFERRTLHERYKAVGEVTLEPNKRESSSEPQQEKLVERTSQSSGLDLGFQLHEALLHERYKEVGEMSLEPNKRESSSETQLDLGFQLREAFPKHENGSNDDLASLLSFRSFADSGYGSEIIPSDLSELRDGSEELVSLLRSDSELQSLFEEAFQRGKAREQFVSKFRMLLKIFGTELKKEAIDPSHGAAADFVQIKATCVAINIKKAYETGVPDTQDETRSANLEALLQQRYDLSSDSDSEAEEPNEGAKLAPFSLDALKTFMTTSKAFANLRNAFRRMVYPDPLAAISNAILREHQSAKPSSTTAKSSATFHLHWDISDYIRTELGYDSKLNERKQLLESVLVVVGSASTAYATSATNYMRWRWPDLDYGIMRIVYSTLMGTSKDTGDTDDGLGKPKIVPTLHSKTEASFRVIGSLEQIIAVAQQLAWIATSFRVPIYGQVSYSEVLISRTGDMVFDLFPTPLERVRERRERVGTCWLPLFTNSIIARGLSVPAREGEVGIEIPFALMTALANVMYPVFHNGSIYLRGFSNLLFPANISSDMKSAQWHLTTSNDARSHIPHGTLPGTTDKVKWARCDDLEQLASTPRTFLGCYRRVHVNLGTGALAESAKEITFSNTDNEKPAAGLTPKAVSTGFAGLGIWSAQVHMDFVLPKGLISTEEPGWYLDMLDLAKNTPLIVYDNAKKAERAWLVPKLGVVLHMAHVWACSKTDLLRPIPTASPHWDSGEAALNVLKKHSKDELRDGLAEGETYCLRDLIGRLLRTLHKLEETQALAKLEPSRTVKFEGSRLYGWELLDVVRGKKILFRKQVDISQDWMVLGENSIVLFCQNFGDIIEPASEIKLCPRAQSLHQGANRLTATIKCLQQLSEEQCGSKDGSCLKIANQAYWLCPGDEVFKDCTHGSGNSHAKVVYCEKLPQQIGRAYVCPRRSQETPPIEGAVIFGKKRLQRLTASSSAAPCPTDHATEQTRVTEVRPKQTSKPQLDANLANTNGNVVHSATNDANSSTDGAPLSETASAVHKRMSRSSSFTSSFISRMAGKAGIKSERKPALRHRNCESCQPQQEPAADLQVTKNAYKLPDRTRKFSVTRESFRRSATRYPTQDKDEEEVRPQYDQGTNNARIAPTRGFSVTHEPLHQPTSHPPRPNAAHHSLQRPTSGPPVHDLEKAPEREMKQIIDVETHKNEGRVSSSFDQFMPAGNRLRRSVRRSDVAQWKRQVRPSWRREKRKERD